MRGLYAFLVLLATLPLSLTVYLLGFLGQVARIAWVAGLDTARWVLDPYPTTEEDEVEPGPERISPIGSPRSVKEILEEAALKNAQGSGLPADPLAGGTFPLPAGDAPSVANHVHAFTPLDGGGVRCTVCNWVPPTPGTSR